MLQTGFMKRYEFNDTFFLWVINTLKLRNEKINLQKNKTINVLWITEDLFLKNVQAFVKGDLSCPNH